MMDADGQEENFRREVEYAGSFEIPALKTLPRD
jgi:hypothetical protein